MDLGVRRRSNRAACLLQIVQATEWWWPDDPTRWSKSTRSPDISDLEIIQESRGSGREESRTRSRPPPVREFGRGHEMREWIPERRTRERNDRRARNENEMMKKSNRARRALHRHLPYWFVSTPLYDDFCFVFVSVSCTKTLHPKHGVCDIKPCVFALS